MSETAENAGAAVLSAGNYMSPKDVVESLKKYHVNVLCGGSNQIVQLAHFISTLPEQERRALKLDRIIYTSEVLNKSQRKLIRAVLGNIKICSIMGSAEAGPWAVSHPDLTGVNDETGVQDFVFDTRSMVVEIFPLSVSEDGGHAEPLPEGEQGIVVQTSLSRMRNPVIRYNTGDVASIHPLPESAREHVPAGEWEHLRVLRLHGRDRRFGFKWNSIYFQFSDITATMNNEECGILQWQVILDQLEESRETTIELRLLCPPRGPEFLPHQEVVGRLRNFFKVYAGNEHRFKVAFVNDMDEFERSTTGRKIIKFVNRVA